MFNRINFSIEELETIYKKDLKKGVLQYHADQINKKLEKINEYFNKLYYLSDWTYKFEISLDKNSIDFDIKIIQNKNPSEYTVLNLNHQSTGFKWFFNLFFNFLASNTIKPNSIIIMDEPATHLHASGQQELRKFLKKFAIDNSLTIIMATHSPFLIDLDYLDELRIINLNGSDICDIN